MNMLKIKNIVFDLGGVIMNLDVSKTIKEFESIGITNIVNNTGHHYKDAIFYDLETGKVTEFEFIEKLKSLSSLNPSTNEIRKAWNAMIFDIPRSRIDILLHLKKDYKIYLLSNTNSIHQKKFLTEVYDESNLSFNELFVKAYYSHEIGLRKPHEEVFEFVIKDSNLDPTETLFIDDSIQNINAAKNLDIQTFHIQEGHLFEDIFI